MGKRAAMKGAVSEGSKQQPCSKAPSVVVFYSDREGNPYREFSNFYRHEQPFQFELPAYARREGFPTSVWCHFSEKAIMATKAALMGDAEIFQEIDASNNPKDCKSLGRGVRNFDEAVWKRHLEETAFEVVKQKFAAEPKLSKLLLSTGNSVLAEAAPNDAVWGIGLALKDPRAKDPKQWCGQNVLGHALMKARAHLRGDQAEAVLFATNDAVIESEEQLLKASQNVTIPDKEEIIDVVEIMPTPLESSKSRRWGRVRAKNDAAVVDPPESLTQAASLLSPANASVSSYAGVNPAMAKPGDFDCFAVLDFEATCDDQRQMLPQEIIEFPIVLVHAGTGKVLNEFRTYVRPVHHPQLTAFCKQLTGITQEQVDSAPAWQEALHQVQSWLEAQLGELKLFSPVFVTCGDWDLDSMMWRQCELANSHVPQRFRQWINVKNLFRKVTGTKGGGMAQMLAQLGLRLEGHHHSGLDDSRNIARILQELLKRGGPVDMDIVCTKTQEFRRKSTDDGKGRGKGGSKVAKRK